MSSPPEALVDFSSPALKREVLLCVLQWLYSEGFSSSLAVLHDECGLQVGEFLARRARLKRLRKSLIDGDWASAEKLCTPATTANHRTLLFELYKQEFLEMIDKQEIQKAFQILQRRLKPLESFKNSHEEFQDLCYLLSCQSVASSPSYRGWSGAAASRERLAEKFDLLTKFDANFSLESSDDRQRREIPPNRLENLIRQAILYQIASAPGASAETPRISTILRDYQPRTLPNCLYRTLSGHSDSIKTIAFVPHRGLLVSGSSDNSVRLWDCESGKLMETLTGHSSRVWSVSCSGVGEWFVSGSSDGTVKLWRLADFSNPQDFKVGNQGDFYTVAAHPRNSHILAAGLDKIIYLIDVETGQAVRALKGHTGAITSAIFNTNGNLIISGSKDASVRFFDLTSGACVESYSGHFNEISSIALNVSGSQLLTACKDNSHRLFDLRSSKFFHRYRGHQNSRKNFLNAEFGPNEEFIVSASEDGGIYIWDKETEKLVETLSSSPSSPVSCCFQVKFSSELGILAAGAQDKNIRLWKAENKQNKYQTTGDYGEGE